MKYIPRAEITTIKELLYPLKKKKDYTWDRRNLEDLRQLKKKVEKMKEEKQKEEENKHKPLKLRKYKDISSKFKEAEIIQRKRQENSKMATSQIIVQNNNNIKQTKNINKSISIKKLPNISNDIKNNSSIDINKTKEINNEQKNSNTENEPQKMFTEDLNSPSIFEKPMSNSEEIDQLIKEYREKYGNTEVLESLLKEYEEMKKNKNIKTTIEEETNLQEEKNIREENNNIQVETKDDNQDNIINYEPIKSSGEGVFKKPPIPPISEVPLILPKINKNYIKENIQLIINNKIPQKKYVQKSEIPEQKHKNFGKVPGYIKKYEKERELEKQEKLRRLEEKKYPKGTKLLSEEERVKTLNALIKSQQEMNEQYQKMPISNKSYNIQKRKEELIKKLNEIDRAIEMFSRKKVFIKKD